MIAIILEDILEVGYAYREPALFFGGIGFAAYGIWKIINISMNRNTICKRTYLYRDVLGGALVFAFISAYLTYVIAVTLSGREAGSRVGYMNAGLFETLLKDEPNRVAAIENFLMLLPYGITLPVLYRGMRTWKRMGLSALLLSFGIESMQLMTGRGYFQIDDIVLNGLGALCGYFIFWRLFFCCKSN